MGVQAAWHGAMEVASATLESEVMIQNPPMCNNSISKVGAANIAVNSLTTWSYSADQIAYFQGLILTQLLSVAIIFLIATHNYYENILLQLVSVL